MPNEGNLGELATARLELPTPFHKRSSRSAGAPRHNDAVTLEASIRRDASGALVVSGYVAPPSDVPIPLLAYLQFISRFEEAAAQALTNAASGKP